MFARVFPRLVFVLLAAALLWAVLARDTGAGAHARVHTVRPGDTLWSIAVASYPGDPRKGVWRLQQRNGLADAMLVPGQRLVVP